MSVNPTTWYIVAQETGECLILTTQQLSTHNVADEDGEASTVEFWGPFDSKETAIAKRVGLIRSGKCKAR